MGIELELGILLIIQLVGTSVFAPFELNTSPLKKIFKWSFLALATIVLYFFIGHWAIIISLLFPLSGLIYHITWCKKHGIDPIKATPRKRYYELKGWNWPD
nr:hypothetical protein [candidate division Zixibacteria bacterium]